MACMIVILRGLHICLMVRHIYDHLELGTQANHFGLMEGQRQEVHR